ncbi:hypothetical protein ONZ45_g17729 [Pleurotus djamor]|nr:hypothetical protein ONZ45_g17729 [Pleurotus djamor]
MLTALTSATPTLSPEDALTAISHRATYRFEVWLEKVAKDAGDLQESERPPLDVTLALHTMMLYPHRFFGDMRLRSPKLKRFQNFPYHFLTGDPTTGVTSFEDKTSLKYDPVDSLSKDTQRLVTCPYCSQVQSVYWNSPTTTTSTEKVGFLEDFKHTCTNDGCKKEINIDALCVAKFMRARSSFVNNQTPFPYLLDFTRPNYEGNMARAREASQRIYDAVTEETTAKIMTNATSSSPVLTGMEYIESKLAGVNLTPNATLEQVLRPFSHTYKNTQNLVPAMAISLKKLGLLQADGVLSEGDSFAFEFGFKELHDQYATYFNGLKTSGVHIGPPLRVDLVWHTHILEAKTYRDNCIEILGVFPDHVPRSDKKSASAQTAVARPDDLIVSTLVEQQELLTTLATNYATLQPSTSSSSTSSSSTDTDTTSSLYTDMSTKLGEILAIWQKLKAKRPLTDDLSLALITNHPSIVLPHRRLAQNHYALADLIMQLNEEHPEDKCQDTTV